MGKSPLPLASCRNFLIMPSHDNTLEEIKDRIDIVDLISDYVLLKKAGQNWKGLCPFHTEKSPSFMVNPAKQIFHCFGCGSGGDIFTFLVKHESLTFPEAKSILAKRAGVTIKEFQQSGYQTGEKEQLLNIHKEAVMFFAHNLANNPAAKAYLERRGIGIETQKAFSLGYAPKSWHDLLHHLGRKGYKNDIVQKAGLAVKGTKGHYDTFRDRVIFPIYNLSGEAVAFGGRSIDGSEPKYLNSPETIIFNKSRILYGIDLARDAIKKEGRALFMEGYLDVITAHIHGFSNAVAPLGTALTPEHGKLIKRFTENVVIVFDSDPAGIKASKKAAGILLESSLDVKILDIPGNEDPDSFLRIKGREAFSALLEKPFSIIEFYMKQKGDRRLIAHELLDVISRVSDKILVGDYIRVLAEKLNVKEELVYEQLKKVKNRPAGGQRKTAVNSRPVPRKKPEYEVYLIKLLLQLDERTEEICGLLSSKDFRDPVTREIFTKINNGYRDLNTLITDSDGEARDFLAKISVEDEFENPEKALDDCIKRLKETRRKAMEQEIQCRIRDAESRGDLGQLKELQAEHQKLWKQ